MVEAVVQGKHRLSTRELTMNPSLIRSESNAPATSLASWPNIYYTLSIGPGVIQSKYVKALAISEPSPHVG